MSDRKDGQSKLERGIRTDLIIALCALMISSVAACASWWQARLLVGQTEVLQEQLGAQVWPYVSDSEGINGNTVKIQLRNDGLGPAIMRSFSISVDGKDQSSYIGVMHALLGPNLIKRSPVGDTMEISIDSGSPGMVIRPGENGLGFSVKSKHFATQLLTASRRMGFKLCYCAIIPGKCWLLSSATRMGNPIEQTSCPEVANDLMHTNAVAELTNHNF
jgi:hypothetical protein